MARRVWFVWVAIVLAALAESQAAGQATPGEPAPGFTLRGIDGVEHRLSAYRGRVVVLEWTSHVCPVVRRYEDVGTLDACRRAAAAIDAAWLAIDSSAWAGEEIESIGAWRAVRGHTHPLLVDPGGEAARAFGAACTPSVAVVDAQGRLAYLGAVDDALDSASERDAGGAGSNYLLGALAAIGRGGVPEPARTVARGCTVHSGSARALPAELAEEVRPAGKGAWDRCADLSEAGDVEGALAAFREAFAGGYPRVVDVIRDPRMRRLLDDDDSRRAIVGMLRERPGASPVVMVAPDEPGTPLLLRIRLEDELGEPIGGAVVTCFHTSAAGYYSAGSTRADNPRWIGVGRTDAQGRLVIRTTKPAPYSGTRGGHHVHFDIAPEGFRPRAGVAGSVYFDDDPHLSRASRREILGDGGVIVRPTVNADGIETIDHTWVLRRL